MNKLFIPYELALALKELGFNEECLAKYFDYFKYPNSPRFSIIYGDYEDYFNNNTPDYVATPTWQQAFDFFREKYKVKVGVGVNDKCLYYDYKIVLFDKPGHYYRDGFNTHEEARLECLKKLIELCKEK